MYLLLSLSCLFISLPLSAQLFTETASSRNLDLDGSKDGGFAFGDLNADGWLDLVVNTDQDDADHRTRVYFNSGPPAWNFTDVTSANCQGCARSVSPDAAPERSLVMADFNGDGYLDFVRNSARRLEVYLNKGPMPVDGDLPYSFGTGLSQLPNFELYTSNIHDPNPPFGIPGGMNTEGLGVFDYDGDGDLDLFIENHDWGMDIYENTGFATAVFQHVTPDLASKGLPTEATNGDYAAVTDVNDDGWVDAIARKTDQLDFFLNSGGTFLPVPDFDQQANNFNKGAAVFQDFDNDGDFDLFWTENDSNRIWLQTGVGSGLFEATPEPWASAGLTDPWDGSAHGIDGIACGDIDHDGDIDIFLADDTMASYLFLNQLTETGSFGFIRDNLGISVNADAEGANFSDIDEDGDLDLYLNIRDDENQLWENALNSTAAALNYLEVVVLENRDASGMDTPLERPALGATVRLLDCAGNPLSGIMEVNGGYGHGNQDNGRVHFGLPLGPDIEYLVEVHYPQFNAERTELRRLALPSSLPDQRLIVRPQDFSEDCNAAPVAGNNFVSTCPGQPVNVNILGNDFDPDGLLDTSSLSILVPPSNGTVSILPDGSLWYVPDAGFTGPDTLLYQICDSEIPPACDSAWVVITVTDSLQPNPVLQHPFCAGFDDGAIVLNPTGGTEPYSYLWTTGDTAAGITGLVEGLYGVQITDALGCTDSFVFELIAPDSIVLVLTSTDASSALICDGTASVVASGGTPPYTYEWTPGGATTTSIDSLCPGTYAVTVTDANGCSAVGVVEINAPDCNLAGEVLGTDPFCAGEFSGSAMVNVSAGIAPFAYLWSTGDTTALVTGLAAGVYTVTVADAAGCDTVLTVVLSDPADLMVSVSHTDISEPGVDDGTATAIVSGGTPPYNYLWNTGDTTAAIDSLPPGVYTVVVTDASGCADSASATVQVPACALVVLVDNMNPLCFGDANGSISADASGGAAPYTYAWSTGDSASSISALSAGSYTLTVTETGGCSVTVTVSLEEPSELMLAATSSPALCGGAGGSVDLIVVGGTPPFSYLWSDGAVTEDLSDIPGGTYSVLVVDSNGCSDSLEVTVDPGTILDLSMSVLSDETCAGAGDGSAIVIVAGGSAPYTYLWLDDGSTDPIRDPLAPGSYTVVVTDASGCTDTLSFDIAPGVPLSVSLDPIDPGCAGSLDGAIDATVSGGMAPYSYNWSNGSSTEDISGLPAGFYSLFVEDSKGCAGSASITLNEQSALTVNLFAVDPACGDSTGIVTATVTGAVGSVSYNWSDGQTGPVAIGLPAGPITVLVSDSFCTAEATVVLSNPEGPEIELSSTNASCALADGTATVNILSTSAPFSILWSDGQSTATATGLAPGSYWVLVTDSAGCASTGIALVGEDNDLNLISNGISPGSCGGEDGLVQAIASGGTPPYTYSWSTGDFGAIVDSLPAGIYIVTVNDAAGCTQVDTVILNDPSDLVLEAGITAAGCALADGSLNLIIAGGSGPYTINWSTGDSTALLDSLLPGSYSVVVTDAQGCSASAIFEVPGSSGLSVVASVTPVSCLGGDGAIDLAISGGIEPYLISWSSGAMSSSLSGLDAGTYFVTITDSLGCFVSDSVIVPIDCPSPPEAVNDTVATHMGELLVIDVLVNDSDPSGASGPAVILSGPDHGTLTANPDGTFDYQPDPGFIGIDSFSYEICNIDGCSTATVVIYVGIGNNPPVALPDVASTSPSTPVSIPIGTNDFDPDGDALTWTLYEVPSNGTAAAGGGWATYVPEPGFAGVDQFIYVLCDPAGLCDTAIVTITVDGPMGGDPVAMDDHVSTLTGESVDVVVLANDASGAGAFDSTSVLITFDPANGTVTVDPVTGEVTYMPDPGFTGVDSFGYQFCNLFGFCDQATVIVTVGDTDTEPTAIDDFATTPESTPVWIPVLDNDLNPDGESTVTILLSPGQGAATVLPDGSIFYIPNPGYSGTDALTYQLCDSNGDCDDAAVIITIDPVNELPVAMDDYASTDSAVSVTIVVLGNDLDPDGDPLTVSVIDGPAGGGTVTINADGSVTYTPGPSDVTDTFTYVICDPEGLCDTAIVVVTVGSTNNSPVTQPDSSSTLACTMVVVEVALNDADPDGDELSIEVLVPAAAGTTIATDDDKIVFIPPDGFVGVVTILYEACDPLGNCTPGEVTIHVLPEFLPPAAFDDLVSTDFETIIGIDVLANDFDPNGSPLSDPTIITAPANGSVVLNPDGTVTYSPNAGFSGTDSFRYQICDTSSSCLPGPLCDEALVVIQVVAEEEDPVDPNQPPVAMDDSVKITQDADVLIAVLANDFDPDGDPLTVLLISDPENGTATVNGAGNVQYDPNPGFSGIDSFQYQICDPFGLCDTAWIIVCVAGDFFVPDVITPNGDGDNDFFVITGIENYPNNTLTIFNRWGDRVWSAGGYVNQWRGTYDDNGDLPDGTYYFILDLGDGSQPITGFVAVFR